MCFYSTKISVLTVSVSFTLIFHLFSLKKETTITEIKQKLMQMPDEVGIVIDGFPRDVAQALSFEDQVRMSP